MDQSISQESLYSQEMIFKSASYSKRESYSIYDPKTKKTAIFLIDKVSIVAQLFNEDLSLNKSFIVEYSPSKFDKYLGYSIIGNTYNLMFTNTEQNQFFVIAIDIFNRSFSSQIIPIKFKREKFLETINYNNNLYLLTIKKHKSIINIYEISNNLTPIIHEINLSEYEFTLNKYPVKLYSILHTPEAYDTRKYVQKIDITQPNTIDVTSNTHKLYTLENKVYLTLDDASDYTLLISIDLDNFSHQIKTCQNSPLVHKASTKILYNSFLYDNYLFQIKGDNEVVIFSIYNRLTDLIVKQFNMYRDTAIALANTPLIQEGGASIFSQGSEKEIEKYNAFFRKIMSGNLGVSVYQEKDTFEITLGGYKEAKVTYGGGGVNFFYSYTNTRSTYFKTLLNTSTFKHYVHATPKNVYDKIDDFSSTMKNGISFESILKYDQFYLFGYYNNINKTYYLKKFN